MYSCRRNVPSVVVVIVTAGIVVVLGVIVIVPLRNSAWRIVITHANLCRADVFVWPLCAGTAQERRVGIAVRWFDPGPALASPAPQVVDVRQQHLAPCVV